MASSITSAPLDCLDQPLLELRGVGAERAAQLARLELKTVGDLLLHRPRRYEDRRQVHSIASLGLQEPATVRGKIVALGVKLYSKRRKSVFEMIVDDGTARLHCRWWNLPYMKNYFSQGGEVLVFGKLNDLKPRTMDHPETEVIDDASESSIHLNRIAPVYPLTEGLPQRWLRALIWRTLEERGEGIREPWPIEPAGGVLGRREAIRALHFPGERPDAARARHRLALDELIEFQLRMQRRRQSLLAHATGCPCRGDNRLIKPFLGELGFRLTQGQTKVLREFRADMESGRPMRRLLQGDVGSGKTVVAACCALLALEAGFSVALMAPTEILADQHLKTFQRWFKPLGIPVRFRTGSAKSPASNAASECTLEFNLLPAKAGSVPLGLRGDDSLPAITIGTHALLESSITMENLGLVIIDEQHRFGVEQRENLVRKGHYPHLLVMTATPIPRTLGLTLYGDLDSSVIDEMPAGRIQIKTFVRKSASLPKVWAFLRDRLAQGRQAFVVMPHIDESGQGIKAVTEEFAAIQKEVAPYKVGMLHGRLGAEAREATMAAFRSNSLQVLLSTSLIEVGIDVPNATVMLIENAEQFGLAQLHQLRGRIGRGAHESYCILITHAKTKEAEQRLQILTETNDGFRIAEADLKLRGPGDLLGRDQSGLPPFRFADLAQDFDLVQQARQIAAELLRSPEMHNRPATGR